MNLNFAHRLFPKKLGIPLSILLYGLWAFVLLSPMADNEHLPKALDHANHLSHIIEAKSALQEGQIPIRIAPWQHQGWRYPIFQFYSQIPYMLGGYLFKFLTPANPILAYKLVLWLALSFSGFFMFQLGCWLTRNRFVSLLAGLTYMSSPYFLVNVHARGAFTEAVAQGILPMVLYYGFRCYATPRITFFLLASTSWFLLATSHLITFLYSSLFAGLFFCLLGIKGLKRIKRLGRYFLAYACGILLASYFLAPVVMAEFLSVKEKGNNPYFRNWLTPLPLLLSPVVLSPTPPASDPPNTPHLNPNVGLPLSTGIVFCTYLFFRKKKPKTYGIIRSPLFMGTAIGLFGLALFLTWSPFNFWLFIPKIFWIIQFPYRILTQVMWTGAIAMMYVLLFFAQRGRSRVTFMIWFLLLLGTTIQFLPKLEKSSVKFQDLMRSPFLGYGYGDYLFLPRFQEARSLVYGVPLVGGDGWLIQDQDVDLPTSILENNPQGFLSLKGNVSSHISSPEISLSIFVDNRIISERILPIGASFDWQIPIEKFFSQPLEKTFHFKMVTDRSFIPSYLDPKSSDSRKLAVRVESLEFIRSSRIQRINVDDVRKNCSRKGELTTCTLELVSDENLVQFPVLFYPKMIEVKVNGREVDYLSIPHQNYALVGLDLPKGLHRISLKFKGYAWANWISFLSWLGVLGAAGISFFRHFLGRGKFPSLF